MDPRYPEQAIPRVDELVKQFKRVLSDMRKETVSNKLGALEREGALVVQELCLTAPRLHEAMVQVSRTRRAALAKGLATAKEAPLTREQKQEMIASLRAQGDLASDEEPEEAKKPVKKAKKAKK